MNDATAATKPLRVLIVDDNGNARAMLKEFLFGEANEFHECEDGADALAAYRTFQPDWVLMDWAMKRVDGLAATRFIIAQFPHAAVVIVSNHDGLELRAEASAAGARGFVLKDDLLSLPTFLARRALECGGKRSATPLSDGASLDHSASTPKAVSPLRSATALQDSTL